MSLESLHALESRVARFVELVHQLKRENEALRSELNETQTRLREQEENRQEWEMERTDIGGRIDKVLGALEGIEGLCETTESSEGGAITNGRR
jgi:chromosome segregation ATPase